MGQRYWHTAVLGIQITLGILLFALLVLLADRHNQRIDLTPAQAFTLSSEAQQVAKSLTEPTEIAVFYNGQQQGMRREFEDLLQLFSQNSSLLHYRLIDLDKSPRDAARYGVSSYNAGAIVIGERIWPLRGVDQESIVDGILRLTRQRTRTLCFVTGHGEHAAGDNDERTGYSLAAKALEKENFEIKEVGLVPPPDEKPECTAVILAGPQRELLPGEVENLIKRLANGGATMVLVEPWAPQSVVTFLDRVGVRLFDDLIIDDRNRFYGADAFMPQVPVFDQQEFGDNLQNAAVFPVSRTVHPGDSSELPSTTLLLAMTGNDSWARLGDKQLPQGEVTFRPDVDKRGPLPAGVIVREKVDPDRQAGAPPQQRIGPLIVYGDSDFPANNYFNVLGNRDLFMSSIALLAEDKQLVAMRQARNPEHFSPMYLTDEQTRAIFWMAVVVQPGLFALLGMLVVWRRRRKASA